MEEFATAPALTPAHRAPADVEGQRVSGTLVRVREEEGYGFIRPDAGPPDFFVNVGSFRNRRDFRRGRRVAFTPGVARRAKDGERAKAAPAWDVEGLDAPDREATA